MWSFSVVKLLSFQRELCRRLLKLLKYRKDDFWLNCYESGKECFSRSENIFEKSRLIQTPNGNIRCIEKNNRKSEHIIVLDNRMIDATVYQKVEKGWGYT